MMSYQNGFVVSLLLNDKPQREYSGENGMRTVHVPFGSEYKIRLKNNNALRAMASISIDGTDVLGNKQIIIPAYGSIDVERFVESLTEGRKFKFVELSHKDIQDPTSKENGIVTVHFFLEKTPEPILLRSLFGCTSKGIEGGFIGSVNCNAGGTVEGSRSEQAFSLGTGFQTESFPTTIQIKMLGPERKKSEETFITKDGRIKIRGEFIPGAEVLAIDATGITVKFKSFEFLS